MSHHSDTHEYAYHHYLAVYQEAKEKENRLEKKKEQYKEYIINSGEGNKSYWEEQVKYTELEIIKAKKEVENVIDNLAKKGVNATKIKEQNELTETKIAEISKKLENLPETKIKLVEKYEQERETRLNNYKTIDWVKERSEENKTLFGLEENLKNEIKTGRSR